MSFDHGALYRTNRSVHRWMVRRWNSFSIGVVEAVGEPLAFLRDV
jgi:hypothetical protein